MIRAVFRFIFSFFFWLCSCVGAIVLLIFFALYSGRESLLSPSLSPVQQDSVLSITLNGKYIEQASSTGLESLILGKNTSLYDLTRVIEKAAYDDKIKGVVVHIESPQLGIGQLQELRDALLTFRKVGKKSWCYTDTFEETSSGTKLYYLATACDQIWMQPLGTVNLTGIQMETIFAKNALEKLDIKVEFAQRKEYKSFIESFTRDDFSESSRAAHQALVDSILSQIVDGIAQSRNFSHDHVRFLIANGPYLTQPALTAKLVDHLGFRQELLPAIRDTLGQHIAFTSVSHYLHTLSPESKGDKIALIFGSGIIQRNGNSSPLQELVLSSSSTYKALQLALQDPEVKAIVYRINSNGGSHIASETIYSMIHHVKEHAKKPVIVSMGDAAASGGYWISVAGSKIVAQPATLTGSIGVFGGKYVLSGFLEKLGIKFRAISTSENSTLWNFNEPFTPAQWVTLNALMDEVYQGFTARVAKNRHMSAEQVEKVARGRVWTGEQALALGLVDQLGGISTAIELAKKEANLKPEARVEVFPKRKSFFEGLASLFVPGEEENLSEGGLFGTFLQPFRNMIMALTFFLSSQEILSAPMGEVK